MEKFKRVFLVAISLFIIPSFMFAQMTWTQTTANAGWSGRIGHTSVEFDNKMWVIGGFDDASGRRNDVWYSTDGVNWIQTTANAQWSARYFYTSVVFDNKIWVIGGEDTSGRRNDVWYSTDGVNWTQATADAGWTARSAHTSVVFDNKIWVMGGEDYASIRRNDVWYSTDGANWTQATANAGWSARDSHTAVVFDNKIWVMGGSDASSYKNDVWYSSNGVNWTQATANAGWSARYYHASVVFDNKIWVMGGRDGSIKKNDVWYSRGIPSQPEIWVYPSSFYQSLLINQTKDSILTIGNSGGANLTWNMTEVPSVVWLSENPTDGNILPDSQTNIIITFNASGISPGCYQCTLRITNNDPSHPKADIQVQLNIPGWVQKESIPTQIIGKYLKDGGALVTTNVGLFTLRGNKSNEFYKYAVVRDSWAQLESILFGLKPSTWPPKTNNKKVGKGAAMCFDGDSIIYTTRGNGTFEFWAYDVAYDTWAAKPFIPVSKVLKGGTSIVYKEGKVYLLAGSQKSGEHNFYVYDVATNSWISSADLERGPNNKLWKDGSCLTILDNTIYALKGGDKYNPMYAFNGTNWTAVDSMPVMDNLYGRSKKLKIKDGGAMCAGDGVIYAIKGGGANVFWKFTTTEGWTQSESIPRLHKKSVPKTGAALAYANGQVYLLKGNNTPEFWCYTPSMSNVKTQMSKPHLISGVMAESTKIYPFMLYQNSPNPFNSLTAIRYSIPRECNVSLSIFDITGKLVKTLINETMNVGVYTISWNGNDNEGRKVGQGVYFYILKTTDEEMQKKMLMLR